jgi:hypothetical protein
MTAAGQERIAELEEQVGELAADSEPLKREALMLFWPTGSELGWRRLSAGR